MTVGEAIKALLKMPSDAVISGVDKLELRGNSVEMVAKPAPSPKKKTA